MHKTVVVSSPANPLSRHLQTRGYKVIDVQEATRPGSRAIAIISAGYRPGTCQNPWAEQPADISLGGYRMSSSCDVPVLQATGLQPQQVAERLQQQPDGPIV